MADTEAVERQIQAVIDAARNVEWEAHFGSQWDKRAAELAKARDYLLALTRTPIDVEAVARAMFEDSAYGSIKWETASNELKQAFRKPARAAIAAMRANEGN